MRSESNIESAIPAEPVIDPSQPICDAHHHLWDKPGSRYLLPELLADLSSGHAVRSTVFIEWRSHYRSLGPSSLRPVGETEFADAVAREALAQGGVRACAGIVGFADLMLGKAAAPVIEAHLQAGGSRFKGLRHVAAWDRDIEVVGGQQIAEPGLYRDAAFRQGFALLRSYGLTFDAWIFYPQMDDLIDLARSFPEQRIVLNHVGGVLGIGRFAGRRDELFPAWRKCIDELARCPNVYMKLGGLGMKRSGFSHYGRAEQTTSTELADTWRPWFETCIDAFGADRCMFESNFPVDAATCTYRVLWNTFKRISSGLPASARAALMHDTATRFYGIAKP